MKDNDAIHNYDSADRHFYDLSAIWGFLRVLVAIALTVGVLWWFNS